MTRISRMTGPGGPPLFSPTRETRELSPGAVHVPDWLSGEQQRELVALCRQWVRGRHRLEQQVLAGGGVMSVRSAVLGQAWDRPWHRGSGALQDGSGPDLLPEPLPELGVRAIEAAYGTGAPELKFYRPTTALINFYDDRARMGMHQDLDESGPDPIISLSLGDTGIFRFGNPQTRGQPYRDIELRSGDLLVFGRQSRWAYHGVPAIRTGTGDPRLGMRGGGRLNITLRRTAVRPPVRRSARAETARAPETIGDDRPAISAEEKVHGA